jgi:PilZ domain-containing protein
MIASVLANGKTAFTRDRRAGRRIAVNQRAELNSGGDGWFPCRVMDMSDSGFFLICDKALAVEQKLDLRCELYPEKRLECKIEIRRVDETGIGTKIVEIDRKSVGFCQLFLQEYYSDTLNKSG